MNARCVKIIFTMLVMFALAGCAEKAKLVQLGAEQFAAQSKAAIEKIDALRRAETAVTPLAPAEAKAKFTSLVLKSKKPITRRKLRLLTDPLRSKRIPGDESWQSFMGNLRHHHETFTKIFARLDQGSFLAAPTVKKTIPFLDKLMGQIIAFAKSIEKQPAEMTRERAAIATAAEFIRDDPNKKKEVKELLLAEIYQRLVDIERKERDVTREVLEQSLKAAIVGKELRELLQNYDQLSLNDIAEGINIAINLSGKVLGKDLSSLNQKAGSFIADIEKDKDLKGLLNVALKEINAARNSK